MKKNMIGALLCLFVLNSTNAQDPDLYFRDQQLKKQEENPTNPNSIKHSSGFVIKVGEKVKLGRGTMPDGTFKYIRANAASLFSYSGPNANSANSANALMYSYNGLMGEVARIENRGNKRRGYVTYLILKLGLPARYEVDLDNAIQSGEIVIPDEFKPKEKPLQVEIKGGSFSLADELIKLKKLLDDGILTKEEFEAQKKKLLDKKEQ